MIKGKFSKQFLWIGMCLFSYFISPTASLASEQITLQTILHNPAALKAIAQHIYDQPGAVDAIQKKQASEHGSHAKLLWQTYDRSMIGAGKTYSTPSKFKDFIQSGNQAQTYAQLKDLKSTVLKDLIGKKDNGFYSDQEIAQIPAIIQETINDGIFGAAPSGGQPQTVNRFSVTLNKNFGEICTRPGNTATNAADACSPADKFIVVFNANDIFKDIITSQNYDSWKNKGLKGEILTIVQKIDNKEIFIYVLLNTHCN